MAKDPRLQTISINLPRTLVERVQFLGFNSDISVSSIVEQSLRSFLTDGTNEDNADRLKALGASLRRAHA